MQPGSGNSCSGISNVLEHAGERRAGGVDALNSEENGNFCCVSNIFQSASISIKDLKNTKVAKYCRVGMN